MVLLFAHLVAMTPVTFRGNPGYQFSATASAVRKQGHVVLSVRLVNVSPTVAEFIAGSGNMVAIQKRDGIDVAPPFPGNCPPAIQSTARVRGSTYITRLNSGEAITIYPGGPPACDKDFEAPGHYTGMIEVRIVEFKGGVEDDRSRESFVVPWQLEI